MKDVKEVAKNNVFATKAGINVAEAITRGKRVADNISIVGIGASTLIALDDSYPVIERVLSFDRIYRVTKGTFTLKYSTPIVSCW